MAAVYRSGALMDIGQVNLLGTFSLRLPLLVTCLLLAGCGEQPSSEPKGGGAPSWSGPSAAAQEDRLDRSKAGTQAPPAAFLDGDGESITLADFRGRPLLLNLWATWCAPCIEEMPTLDALAASDRQLQVLTVSQDLNGREKVDAFFAKHRFAKLEPYLDPEMKLMTALGAEQLPTTILYDAEGREVWRYSGKADWMAPTAAAWIREARAPS